MTHNKHTMGLLWFPGATIAKNHTWSGFNNRNLLSHNPGAKHWSQSALCGFAMLAGDARLGVRDGDFVFKDRPTARTSCSLLWFLILVTFHGANVGRTR